MHYKPINLTFVQIKNRFSTRGSEQRSVLTHDCTVLVLTREKLKEKFSVTGLSSTLNRTLTNAQCKTKKIHQIHSLVTIFSNTGTLTKKDAFIILFYIHQYSYDLLFL